MQLLKNPDLKWDGNTRSIWWQPGDGTPAKKVDLQNPNDFEYTYEEPERANQVPQSLHRDNEGFNIATGYQKFECGYQQVRVAVERDTRAVFRMAYKMYLHQGRIPWSKIIVQGVDTAQSDWTLTDSSPEKLFAVRFTRSGFVTVKFLVANTEDASTVMDFIVTSLTGETVASDYGGASVPAVTPEVDNEPTPAPTPTPAPRVDFPVTAVLFTVIGIVIALVLVGLAGRPVSAQVVDPIEIISIQEAAAILLSAIAAIVAGGAQSFLVQPLVQLLKLVFRTVSTPVLTLGAAVLVTVAFWVARIAGLEPQLNTLFDLLKVVLPPLVALLTSIFGSKALYALFRSGDVALFGWQRSAPRRAQVVARRSPKIVPLPTEYVDNFER